ncbi:uncharacterized protein LOC105828295 [Monomorium pharaonis]|uniref:uncharacterized protein LOC105828295 n=1 Tax=Monomorium pharaonis TaxID=307658 RepID=UPI00063F8694|nr:uncharacterized protein LOC105828295 [Monomorium pharaonis]XP_012522004.1 uncharacterized protein LOC105828295 [Monomorium pharaonis]XP_012522005.1 uncharacterized protein LOC105828295 [Monomorium pharaonis]XP_028048641.1 uncharacterized protein LOC105828295 [Monomorium pharaonis]XP_036145441.1 uncharacterized protein LOC105828295 [Monomorium pharaonis]
MNDASCVSCVKRNVPTVTVVKMATPLYTEVSLLDGEENKVYSLKVTVENAEKAYKDYQFAATLLERAKTKVTGIGYSSSSLESLSSTSTNNESSVSDCNKENEDTKEISSLDKARNVASDRLICL